MILRWSPNISLISIAFSLLIFCIFLTTLEAETITVDKEGNADFNTIQEAVDEAEEGDHILISQGIYNESVVMNKPVSIQGSGMDRTMISTRSMEIFMITADNVNMSNVTIIASGNDTTTGVKVVSRDCRIENIHFIDLSIGIHVTGSNNMIQNNVFTGSTLSGIAVNGTGNTIQWNIFENNMNSISTTGSGNSVIGNTCSSSQEFGIIVRGSDQKISRNICSNNSVGIYVGVHGQQTQGILLESNLCNRNGDGIYLISSTGAMITNNTCSQNTRFGIGLKQTNQTELSGNSITLNRIGIRIEDHESAGNSIVIHFNSIFNNLEYGLKTDTEFPFNATLNFWGSSSGPRNPVDNPDGGGDPIQGNALTIPWLDENGRAIYPSDEEPDHSGLVSMISVILFLLILLELVVRMPESHFEKIR